MSMKKINNKLNKSICIKCGKPIRLIAQTEEKSCYQCPNCHARYYFEKTWQIYNEKTFEWNDV